MHDMDVAFYRFMRDVDERAEAAVKAMAEAGADKARALCPVGLTGHLKASIRVEPQAYDGVSHAAKVLAGGTTEVDYADYVEHGTEHMVGRHFMQNSMPATANLELLQQKMKL